MQLSKLIQSREKWKEKAIKRATENRENRKQTKDHQEKIAELKIQLKAERAINESKKKRS